MTAMPNPLRHLLTILSSAIIALGALGAGELAPPAPVAVPDEGAFLVAIIPDLRATLGHAEQIAETFNPGKTKPGALVTQAGAVLGDPELANFAGKPLMIAVGPGAPTPSFALLLPGKDAQLYLDAAAQRGMVMGKVVDGLAVVAQTPDGQALGERIAAAYGGLVGKPIAGDLRLLVAPDRLVATYGAFLTTMMQMGMKNAPRQPGGPDVAKILGLEVAGLFAMLGDIGSVQVDVDLAGGMVKVASLAAAKPGTALAKALVAPAAPAGKPVASRMGGEPGLMALSGRMNIQALFDYMVDLLGRLQARPEAKDLLTDDLVAQLKSWPMPWTGDLAVRLRSADQAPFLFDGVYGSADAAKAQASFDRAVALFTGDGALAKLYQGLGVTMAMTKDVRSVGGLQVQRMGVTLDPAKLPPDQVEAMKAMMHDYEFAVGKDWVALAQEPKTLDALVAGAGPGLTLRAEKAIGAGRQLYLDLDTIGLMRAQMRMAGDKVPDQVRRVFDKLASGEPVAVAWTAGEGRGLAEYRVPLAPFAELAKAFREQQAPKQAAPDGAGNGF
jgi:hypothetical protein